MTDEAVHNSIENSIRLLQKAVKPTGTNDQKHIDLTLVSAEARDLYEKALIVTRLAIESGKISRDELNRRLGL